MVLHITNSQQYLSINVPGRRSASPAKKQKVKNSNSTSTNNDDGYQAVCDSFETVMQSFSTLVKDMKANKSKKKKELAQQVAQSSRPKMIHTAKTRVDQEGKKKTKTLITRTTASSVVTQPVLHSYKSERNRPRTKNVNYHVLQAERPQPAVFPDAQLQSDLENILSMTTPIKIKPDPDMQSFETSPPPVSNEVDITTTTQNMDSPLKDIKGIEKFNSDLVHDLEQILQSPIRPKFNSESSNNNGQEEQFIQQVNQQMNQQVNQEIVKKKKDVKRPASVNQSTAGSAVRRSVRNTARVSGNRRSVVTDFKDVVVKEEILDQDEYDGDEIGIFKCEMCSESFTTRSELLVHVPIHI